MFNWSKIIIIIIIIIIITIIPFFSGKRACKDKIERRWIISSVYFLETHTNIHVHSRDSRSWSTWIRKNWIGVTNIYILGCALLEAAFTLSEGFAGRHVRGQVWLFSRKLLSLGSAFSSTWLLTGLQLSSGLIGLKKANAPSGKHTAQIGQSIHLTSLNYKTTIYTQVWLCAVTVMITLMINSSLFNVPSCLQRPWWNRQRLTLVTAWD